MVKSTFLFSLFLFLFVPGQRNDNFDRICLQAHAETSKPKAFKIADSLYKSSDTPLKKAKSLLLIATLDQQIGNSRKAFLNAEKAKAIISKTDEYDWNFRITGFLATQYRCVGLYSKAEQYISEAQEISKKILHPKNAVQAKILISQEIAYHELHKKRYQKAIEQVNVSLMYLKQLKSSNVYYSDFITANSYELLGKCYLNLKNYSESERYFNEAKKLLKNSSFLLGFVYDGLGIINTQNKNWDVAKEYLDKADRIADSLNYRELKKQVCLSYSEYYDALGKPEAVSKYYREYIEINDKINVENQEFLNESYIRLDSSNTISTKKNTNKTIIITCLIIASIGLSIFYRIRYKRQHNRFTSIIDSSKETETGDNNVQNFIDEEDIKKKNESPMSAETEVKLLNLLDEFEKSSDFNDKNMSLTTLAAKLNTNIRYLSYVINTHKKEEFKTYINKLRIAYIISKLTTEEKYRNYKISALAEECGFSTHSKFAAVFKSITGISPSVFIKFMDKNDPTNK